MKKIRFGVLSTAKIGVAKVIPAMQHGQQTEVVAIASRSADKARDVAARLGIPRYYGSYEALLLDPDVDAIYIPLPNDQHVPWSIRALEAGKHVLCEKPIGLSADEARRLREASRLHPRLKLMEAFMYRHHPQWRKAKELVDAGRIGTLRTISTLFSFFNDDPANIRHDPAMGGGGLMDLGCYAISLSRWILNAEPRRVIGWVQYDSRFQVDRLASAILDFGECSATFTCSMQMAAFQQVEIFGTEGRIELAEVPFNAPNDRPCALNLQHGEHASRIEFDPCDQYAIQGDLFAQSILDDRPVPTPIDDAVRNMEVLEAIVASGQSHQWIEFGKR
ncbi:MAG TPA: Gfo/Idh/MocA family oxidoreductase [Pirellulales bacterium]|jgi:predicted dehydrogenase|nr:Gfo/Idh/MocA family oxidoreductase [Pirellulales bacterium]